MKFLTDEIELGKRVGRPIDSPIRMFDLAGLGINQGRFLRELAPTFSLLAVDEYLLKLSVVDFLRSCLPGSDKELDAFLPAYYSGEATLETIFDVVNLLSEQERMVLDRLQIRGLRARCMARFELERSEDAVAWSLQRVAVPPLAQDVGVSDIRSFPRTFQEPSVRVTDHAEFKRFLHAVAAIVLDVEPAVTGLSMTMHQMAVYADCLGAATNSPEGTHQDGADYIVSALVVERVGVLGGESFITVREENADEECEWECFRQTLIPGQGLFQADKGSPLWHSVTPIVEDPAVPPDYGHRSVIGLDIQVSSRSR